MIDFLKNKSMKAYNELVKIAEQPNLLFSNDPSQYLAEAGNNLYTVQKLNKCIKNNKITINEIENVFKYVEDSWAAYLKGYYMEKSFVFYMWGDYQIPAIRFSIVSLHTIDQELPFDCTLETYENMQPVIIEYQKRAYFDGIPISYDDSDPSINIDCNYRLIVYSRVIEC
ncbi:hypothetical protein D3C73_615650 [compost metagenome]